MNSGALVTGCNVGVENTTGPFLGGGAAAYFNSGATIQSSQTLYAYSTYLNSGVSLGPVDTDRILGNGGATYGPVSTLPGHAGPARDARRDGGDDGGHVELERDEDDCRRRLRQRHRELGRHADASPAAPTCSRR